MEEKVCVDTLASVSSFLSLGYKTLILLRWSTQYFLIGPRLATKNPAITQKYLSCLPSVY